MDKLFQTGDFLAKKSEKKRDNNSKESDNIVEKKADSKFIHRRYFFIIAVIIIVICIIGIFWFFQGSDVAQAQLVIESGEVYVKHKDGSWIEGDNGMLLYQSDSVMTKNNSFATIVLFESSVIRLDSNTEIMIKEIIEIEGESNVLIQQDSGRTWNTVLKISGIDNYEVQTPTTVATVRGTSFDVHVFNDGTTGTGVSRGVVMVSSYLNGQIIDSIDLFENEFVTVDPEMIHEALDKGPFEKDDWVHNNEKKDEDIQSIGLSSFIDSSLNVKNELYKRIEPYIPELKSRYGMTDEELDALIDGYLLDYYDLPPETPDWIRDIIEIS
jgi:hypothetical protein